MTQFPVKPGEFIIDKDANQRDKGRVGIAPGTDSPRAVMLNRALSNTCEQGRFWRACCSKGKHLPKAMTGGKCRQLPGDVSFHDRDLETWNASSRSKMSVAAAWSLPRGIPLPASASELGLHKGP